MNYLSKLMATSLLTSLSLLSTAFGQAGISDESVQKQKTQRPIALTQSGLTMSVYYNTMSQLKADKDIEFGSSYSGMRWKNLSYELEQAPGLTVAYQQRPLEGFGFGVGGYFDYFEKERKITSAKTDIEVYGLNVPFKSTEMGLTFQEWGIEGNLIYSANKIYFPVGAHISFITINGGTSNIKNQSGIGFQAGAGFQPVGWFAAELGLRTTSVGVKYDQAKEDTYLTGSGITLMSKFLF